ncbi:hypothetical protein BLA29_005919, partial [Euroglyphus maynei]
MIENFNDDDESNQMVMDDDDQQKNVQSSNNVNEQKQFVMKTFNKLMEHLDLAGEKLFKEKQEKLLDVQQASSSSSLYEIKGRSSSA